jgi:hypothetical protein
MMCEQSRELIAAAWLRELTEADERSLRVHVEFCAECREEMAGLGAIWERLGELPAPEPGRALDVRWQATLESSMAAESRPSWRWWPRTPVWQAGIALACLIVGVLIGTFAPRQGGEIAELRREIETTRAMVAISLLQQQSASQRLKGVDYSGRMTRLEPEVASALIEAVNRDPSTNVRLAAIDALGRAAGNSGVAESLARSLRAQDSPMVQAALIDYLADARDRRAVGVLEQFEKRPDIDPAVMGRAQAALTVLGR